MEPGTELAGRYRLETPLGPGGTGEVWCCRDLRLDREVAVKLLPPGVPGPEGESRFRREAECAAGLRHPGIAGVLDSGVLDSGVLDSGRHERRMFVVTELPGGQDLAARLRAHPAGLPVDQVLAIGAEVAAALAYAHGEGIVHRDLRPLNIFIQDDGPVRVCDFGIARYLGAAVPVTTGPATTTGPVTTGPVTGTGRLLGTPEYRSPEQWADEPVTPSADLYALGCTLYELLTGQLPFQGPSLPALIHRHLVEVPVPPRDRRPEVPAALSDLVIALLAKAPENRPPGAGAVAAALTQIRDHGLPASPGQPPAASRPPLACTSPAAGVIDVHAVDSAGRIRRCTGTASGSAFAWHGWGDLPPQATGKVTALAAGSSGRGVHVTAVIDGVPCVNEGLADWSELLRACPLRLPVADLAVPSALKGTAGFDSVTAYALDDEGVIWSSRAATPLNTPVNGQFSVIAACAWGRTDPGPALLAAVAGTIRCRYWWAGTREFRWRHLPGAAAGTIADVACVSLAARRMEAFVLYDDGSIWQSTLRLAQEAVLDWSAWVRLPLPPGHVTAIAACQVGQRDGAVAAATSEGGIYCATHAIEVARIGLSQWSRWSLVPAA